MFKAMSLSDKTVLFEIPEIDHGFKQANGLMKLWEKGLELEFEIATLGILKSGVQTVRIAYSDIQSIDYKKGWFKDKVIIQGVSMKVFEDVPGTDVATCTLRVKRKHRDNAQNLISKARMQVSEHKLDQMDQK